MGLVILATFVYLMAVVGIVCTLFVLLYFVLSLWYDIRLTIGNDKGKDKNGKA